jgi:hypothetical protein
MKTRSTAIAVKPRSRANRVQERRLEAEQQEEAKKQICCECAKAAVGSFFVPVSLPDNILSIMRRQ